MNTEYFKIYGFVDLPESTIKESVLREVDLLKLKHSSLFPFIEFVLHDDDYIRNNMTVKVSFYKTLNEVNELIRLKHIQINS